MASTSARFRRHVANAAGRLDAADWRTRGSGLIRLHPNGYWAQIVFSGASRKDHRLQLGLIAGVSSPYLLRVVNHQDPEKPPSANFVAAHAPLVWNEPVQYWPDESSTPGPLDMTRATARVRPSSPTVLGEAAAEAWIADAFEKLTAAVDDHCNDRSLRDWLIDPTRRPAVNTDELRYAALLTRNLADKAKLQAILRQVEMSKAADDAKTLALFGRRVTAGDDQDTYPQDWGHARFLRFLDEVPPATDP